MTDKDILRRFRFLLLLSFTLCAPAAAGDTWTTPFNGVRYLHRTTGSPKWDIHVAVVNLSVPGVRLTATSPKDRRTTVSAFAKREGTHVAINASFFSYSNYSTVGLSVGEGTVWTGTKDDGSSGQLVFGDGRAEIVNPAEHLKVEPWMSGIVSGHPLLVWNGQIVAQSKNSSLAQSRHPRTAVGLSKDRRTLFLLVVDGRQSRSVGMTAAEEAQVLKGLGAWTALNMDGGGSSAMYLKGQGIVNNPSDGTERVVANHLGVLLGKSAAKKDNAAKDAAAKAAAAKAAAAKQSAAKEPADKSSAAKAAAEKAAAAAKEAAARSAAAKEAAAKAADAKAAAAKASAGNDAAAKASAEKDVAEKEAAAKAATRKAAAALNTAAKLSAKAAAAKAAEMAGAAQESAAKKTAEISAAARAAAEKAEAATAPARKKAAEMAGAAQDAAEKKTAEIAAAANDAVKRAEAATAPARKKAVEAAGAAHDAAEKKGAEIAAAAKEAAKKADAVKGAAEKKAEAEARSLTRMFNEGYRKIAGLWGRFTQWVKRSMFRQ